MPKKRGLSRGLGALLSDLGLEVKDEKPPAKRSQKSKARPGSTAKKRTQTKSVPVSKPEKEAPIANQLICLPIEQLQPGRYQPRQEIIESELEPLAQSIQAQGILQPIVVRKVAAQKYEIIAGERRWRAAKKAGLTEVPVVIKDVSDEAAMAIGLIENIQRENLNVLEEAMALERLAREFNLTHAQIAQAVGKTRVSVSNLLRLLNLNDDVKKFLERGDIDFGHAKALLGLQGPKQSVVAKMVVARALTVRETENLVSRKLHIEQSATSSERPIDPDIKRLQNQLSEKLGSVVRLSHTQKGSGKIVVRYNSLDELDGILTHILPEHAD